MVSIKPAFQSTKPDDPEALADGQITPSRWNADLETLMATARILGRTTAGNGPIEELDAPTARTLLGIILGAGAGNVPVLDGAGKLATSVLPALALTDTFEVASQSAMLALDAQQGDIAIRTDLNKTFVLSSNSPSTLADWKELRTPTDVVLSVAGLTGTITAAALQAALGLVVGTNVQAYDADLSTIAALAPAEGDVLTYSGGVWTAAPASGGDMGLPGAMTKDPRLLPCYDGTTLSAVYVLGTNTTPDSSGFWTEIGRVGAIATTSTDNTYTQICDITGSGVLFHVISQAITNTTDDVTFRITVDGTVYTIAKTQTWAASGAVNGRVILGVCADYNQIGSKYTTSLNWLYDMAGGGQSTQAFRKGSARATPIPPSEIMNNAMPCVRFDTGLKVEVKVTDVFPTGNGPYCGATYILD